MISRSVEDYLEAIYELVCEKGYARTRDIASKLGVKPPSVTEMLQKMGRQGLIIYKRYHEVQLTEKGEKLAKSVIKRHRLLKEFLMLLGLDEKIAEEDACEMEHSIHTKTVERLALFMQYLKNSPVASRWIEDFRRKCAVDDVSRG